MDKFNPTQRQRHPRPKVIPEPVGNTITVRGKLALLGWPSLHAWAKAHGYARSMAGYAIRTWGNRTDRMPHGGIARQVMRDLRRTLATGKRPEEAVTAEAQNG